MGLICVEAGGGGVEEEWIILFKTSNANQYGSPRSLSLSFKAESVLTGQNLSVLQRDGEKPKVRELYFL